MDQQLATIIGSAFGGAIFTGAIGLVSFWLSARRDDATWHKELKYKAYLNHLELLSRVDSLMRRTLESDEREIRKAFHQAIDEPTAELGLVGSPEVNHLLSQYFAVSILLRVLKKDNKDGDATEVDVTKVHEALRRDVLAVARYDLGIDRKRPKPTDLNSLVSNPSILKLLPKGTSDG